MHRNVRLTAAVLVTVAVFVIDTFLPFYGAVAVLYIIPVLLVVPLNARAAIFTALLAALLTVGAFFVQHHAHFATGAITRFSISLTAIAVTTILALRDRSSRISLEEQARILELSHDTVIIRDKNNVILHWNAGAEKLYGWSRTEAVGRVCSELLECSYPIPEVDSALKDAGEWAGEMVRTRRDGTRLVLASRWLLHFDADRKPVGVIESSADLTEQRRADAERMASEQKYRTFFETAGFAIWEADWSETMRMAARGTAGSPDLRAFLLANPELVQAAVSKAVIRHANQAAADLFDASSRADLAGLNLCGRYQPDCMPAFADLLSRLAGGEREAENEVRLKTLHDKVLDVVLRVTHLPNSGDWSHVLVMAFDVTERNETRARIAQTSAELAHASRVSLLGQLAASITHEVNQPLTAIINYGKSGLSWMSRPEPDLAETATCLARVVDNGNRAADVIRRVKALARKTTPEAECFNVKELVADALGLVQAEARSLNVTLLTNIEEPVPQAYGDRVQIQQVLVNLLVNGLHAMREVEQRKRELRVDVRQDDGGMLNIGVHDVGTGLPDGDAARIFAPFFTTKQDGMGMGLAICRSIIEAQGGSIQARNNAGPGATVSFSVPVALPYEERLRTHTLI